MATAKIALKIRSVTYPSYDSKNKTKKKNPLQRMSSFDFSDESRLIVREETRRRDMSAEGRSRGRYFQNLHSCSTDTTKSTNSGFSSRHRSLRYSQDNCCSIGEMDNIDEPPYCDHNVFMQSPKSPTGPEYGVTLDNSNTERLLDWRRKSPDRRGVGRSRSYDLMQRYCRSPEKRPFDRDVRRRRLGTSSSVPPPETSSTEKYSSNDTGSAAANSTDKISSEGRRRRSQFRRALSVFSLSCSSKDVEREKRDSKSPHKKILRPPTRHVYRRGLSGLPIECSSKYLGLAY